MWYGIGHMTIKLSVQNRSESAKSIRNKGGVPGVVYGPKQQPISIHAPKTVVEKLVLDAGESTIVTLEGLSEPIEVLIQDVAFNAKQGGIEHIDFYAIERGKELTTNVPLHFIGEAPAIKLGGSLTKVIHDIEVTCRPSQLPSHIDVDVTSLTDFESQIKVKDLVLAEGVKVTNDLEEVVALVVEVEEESEPEIAVDIMNIPTVNQKTKEETE